MIHDLLVSTTFYCIVHKHYPHLAQCLPCARYFQHLAFGTWLDEETGELLIPQEYLATIEGKTEQLKTKNYRGVDFLMHFSKYVQYHKWSDWRWTMHKCRRVVEITFPDEIQETLQAERDNMWGHEEQLHFVTGKKPTRLSRKLQKREEIAYSLTVLKDNGSIEGKAVLNYLHNLPIQPFNDLLKNLDEAKALVKTLPLDEQSLNYQKNLLVRFANQTQTIYGNSDVTTRIFPLNASIGLMQRKVRRTLTKDWTELDLKSAELAIVAKVWNIPELEAFLQTSAISTWQYFADRMALPYSEATKGILKDATYALCFGGGEKKAITKALEPLGIDNAAKQFLEISLVTQIRKARNKEIERIRINLGATNAFGHFYSMATLHCSPLSILAGVVQSYELKLLFPCFQLAMQQLRSRHGFKIVLFQHDGFSIVCHDKSETQNRIVRLQKVVSDKAQEMGITTKLEVAYSPEIASEKDIFVERRTARIDANTQTNNTNALLNSITRPIASTVAPQTYSYSLIPCDLTDSELLTRERELREKLQYKKSPEYPKIHSEWFHLRIVGEERGIFQNLFDNPTN